MDTTALEALCRKADRHILVRPGKGASIEVVVQRPDGGVTLLEIYKSEELREFAKGIAESIIIATLVDKVKPWE